MDQQSHFLRLPREIRDLVYKNYVYEKDGYVFDSQTGKFATKSNRNRIDLSLMYTCLQVGNEMKGVALGHNVVVFSTFHSKEYRAFAGIWDYQTRNAYYEKILFVERYAPVLPEAKFDILEHEHPQLCRKVHCCVHDDLHGLTANHRCDNQYPGISLIS